MVLSEVPREVREAMERANPEPLMKCSECGFPLVSIIEEEVQTTKTKRTWSFGKGNEYHESSEEDMTDVGDDDSSELFCGNCKQMLGEDETFFFYDKLESQTK